MKLPQIKLFSSFFFFRVADTDGVYPDPDPTFEKTGPDYNLREKPDSDLRKNGIPIRPLRIKTGYGTYPKFTQ